MELEKYPTVLNCFLYSQKAPSEIFGWLPKMCFCVYWDINVLSYRETAKNYASIFNGITKSKYNTHFDGYSKILKSFTNLVGNGWARIIFWEAFTLGKGNPIQDGPFRGWSRIVGGILKSVSHILHWWNLPQLYLT